MKKLSQSICTIMLVTCAGLVHAQSTTTYDKCLMALEEGDTEQAQRLATVIESKKNLTDENIIKGTRCLEEAWGETYWYHPDYKFWVKGEKAITLKQAAATREVREKLMRKQRCLLKKEKALDDLKDNLLDTISVENDILIRESTEIACAKLHEENPDAAILNPICRKAFENDLHPDLDISDLGTKYRKVEGEQVNTILQRLTVEVEIASLDNSSIAKQKTDASNDKSLEQIAFQSCE